ncbi:hypothetical protein D3C85_1552870 [compost metagenome]
MSTTRIAWMAPTQITPMVASIERENSIRLKRNSTTRLRTSSSETEAMISTAPSAAIGTKRRGSLRNTSTSAIDNAAMTPVSWVRPPAASLIAVRESAPLMAKLWLTAAAMLAAPRAANSRSASIS